jgi:branched-chain amino acid transport system substrate-binding protein
MSLSKMFVTIFGILLSIGDASAGGAPVFVGLDADMSLGSAQSGEAIRRGMEIAIDEINTAGGVIGRPLRIEVRDHRGNPSRGADNMAEFATMENLVAVVGGLHTPVALHELKAVHTHRIIYLSPWAAGTSVVENGFSPNFVFRISVRDEFAGGFLVEKALKRGYSKIALVLENTGWGRSNERAMKSALEAKRLSPASVVWFHWGEGNADKVLNEVERSGAEVVLLVANAPEGLVIVRSMAALAADRRMPILSHWGITGGSFFKEARDAIPFIDLSFLQTFSFLAPPFQDRADRVVRAYLDRYPATGDKGGIFSPVGTAHAYDLIHVLARAIESAGTINQTAVRDALERLDRYEGLVRNYEPPFDEKRHDALDTTDFRMARFDDNGVIVPLGE